MGQVPARARARAPPLAARMRRPSDADARRPVHPGPRQPGRRPPRAGARRRSSRRGRCSSRTSSSRTRTAARARSCSSGTARRSSSSNSRTSATSISTSSRRSSFRPATTSACPSRAAWQASHATPPSCTPDTCGHRSRRDGRGRVALAAALGLVAVLGTPVAGAPPDPRAASGALPQAGGPEVDIPFRAATPGRAGTACRRRPARRVSSRSIGLAASDLARPAGRSNSSRAARPFRRTVGMLRFPRRQRTSLPATPTGRWTSSSAIGAVGGATIRLPVPGGAPPIGGRAFHPSISADGSAVAFAYLAPQTVRDGRPALPPGARLIVLWRRATNVSEVVSFFPNGALACTASEPSVSADGRYVAFTYTGLGDTDDRESGGLRAGHGRRIDRPRVVERDRCGPPMATASTRRSRATVGSSPSRPTPATSSRATRTSSGTCSPTT